MIHLQRFLFLLLLTCVLSDPCDAGDDSKQRLESTTSIRSLVTDFSDFDINGDGINEIDQLSLLDQLADLATDDPVLIVLVEERILQHDQARDQAVLAELLRGYGASLNEDGLKPVLVSASVYQGELHQDGRTLLALRRFFQAVKHRYPSFAGAVLVGSFPESMLIRRWVWKHDSRSATFGGVTYNKGKGPKATFIALDPELIAERTDVVLCDLDGNWEDLYVQPSTDVEFWRFLPSEEVSNQKSWPRFEQIIETQNFTLQTKTYEDFFYIDDAQFKVLEQTPDRIKIQCGYDMLRPEVGGKDLGLPNPLARPDIMVSRINPRHVAVAQPAENLDSDGKPTATPKSAGSPNQQFQRDADLELQLLIEYFNRNLAHRRGTSTEDTRRVATMWTDLQTPSKSYFAQVSHDLNGIKAFPKADAVDFVRFLKTPAILKGISSHSNPSCSVLMRGYKPEDLLAETGGHYWFWREVDGKFVPTYNHPTVRDRVHFSLLRTLWENGKLDDAGSSFYIHGGCQALSPLGAKQFPFNSPKYGGHSQIAESLLFYGNGLALIGRAKVYFDIPRDFDKAFGVDHGRFGDVLREYFEAEANDQRLARSVASRNRTYFWSIIGDWTLKLQYQHE